MSIAGNSSHSDDYQLLSHTTMPYHIDETAGSDSTGDGSKDKPYQSIAYALFVHGQSEAVLVLKDGVYEEPTTSSLKKAKKTADGLEKKRRKAEELAEKDAKEKEARARLLEESKKIKLVEDTSLPVPIKVQFSHFSQSTLSAIRPS